MFECVLAVLNWDRVELLLGDTLDGRQRRLRRDAMLHVRQPALRLPDRPQRLNRVHVAVTRRKAQHASAVLGAHS